MPDSVNIKPWLTLRRPAVINGENGITRLRRQTWTGGPFRLELHRDLFYTSRSDRRPSLTQDTVRYVALGLLVIVIAIILLRRKGKKKKGAEDEF